MFTGIVEECGTVKRISRARNLCRLEVAAGKVLKGTKISESISVNGVCLTVAAIRRNRLVFDVIEETLNRTNLRVLQEGEKVNLERALKANARLGGHFVSGHIDDQCILKKIIEKPNYIEWRLSLKKSISPFVVEKGSVCLDGVSLTVGRVAGTNFSVHLIPHTLAQTTLGHRKAQDRLNIETDILAKYVISAVNVNK